MKIHFFSSVLFLLLPFSMAFGRFNIPKSLNENDRRVALEILAFGTASKILSNPYSLGGYEGFEFGITTESLPTQDLSSLGTRTEYSREFTYTSLSFSKGLYRNVDVAFHFTPISEREGLLNYGGQIRWGFYKYDFVPGGLALMVHRSDSTFASSVFTKTTGWDFVSTFFFEDIAVFFGAGSSRATGSFIGGDQLQGNSGVTDTGFTLEQEVFSSHSLFGINFNFDKLFLCLELDRYVYTSYGAKLGFRF